MLRRAQPEDEPLPAHAAALDALTDPTHPDKDRTAALTPLLTHVFQSNDNVESRFLQQYDVQGAGAIVTSIVRAVKALVKYQGQLQPQTSTTAAKQFPPGYVLEIFVVWVFETGCSSARTVQHATSKGVLVSSCCSRMCCLRCHSGCVLSAWLRARACHPSCCPISTQRSSVSCSGTAGVWGSPAHRSSSTLLTPAATASSAQASASGTCWQTLLDSCTSSWSKRSSTQGLAMCGRRLWRAPPWGVRLRPFPRMLHEGLLPLLDTTCMLVAGLRG